MLFKALNENGILCENEIEKQSIITALRVLKEYGSSNGIDELANLKWKDNMADSLPSEPVVFYIKNGSVVYDTRENFPKKPVNIRNVVRMCNMPDWT